MSLNQLQDSFNYIKKTNLRKLRNGIRLYRSYLKSVRNGKAKIDGLPLSIAIEPTTSCNLRCPECPSGLRSFTRDTGMLETAFFRKMVDELRGELTNLTFYFQGEPYLNPDFLGMVKYASDNGIYTSTSTNAHYFSKENITKTIDSGLDRLIISIDGTTQDTYSQYRVGGSLNKVLEATRALVKEKKERSSLTPHIRFQFLVVAPNEHQIDDAKALAKSIGVDEIVFKTAQIYDYKNGSPLIPKNEKYSRYKKNDDNTFSIKNPFKNECWKMWHSCVITWDGLVVPCCFDKDAKHVLGDLKKESFKKIWNGNKYNAFRQAVLTSRKGIDICTNCTEGMKTFG